uniref:Reverse transcriptase domain-containing protein n=1 Tax=Coleochaete scutata TaxID=3125 RepID=A0A5P9NW41_COLSC|nr:hypothetical protein [Coleochaete scutata]QFU80179.1 hypothetical protein [Coleochaete scutata]
MMNPGTATQANKEQGPNQSNGGYSRTMGLPKGRKTYGNRAAVVIVANDKGQQGKSYNEKSLIIPTGCERLMKLYQVNMKEPGRVNDNLIHCIADINVLQLAYELIKSNKGNMTRGPEKETLDGVNVELLLQISKQLKAGRYKFGPARRIWIPKPGTEGKRPLGIASPRVKIVQKAIQLVMEGIYEPIFLDCSHGFRPGRGTHTALKMLDQQCKNANWFIEADISKCFDTIDHKILLQIIKKHVNCQKTLALIKSALTAGYIELGKLADRSAIGTPQGSILSPLLCNIYMHELDLYMTELIQEHNKGKRRRQNPGYTSLLFSKSKAQRKGVKTDVRTIKKMMRKIPSGDPFDPNYIRICYIRYADDFIVSIIGPHELAVKIKEKIEGFLASKLNLKLSTAKTLITNVKRKAAKFLGTEIRTGKKAEKPVGLNKEGRKVRLTPRVSLHAPIRNLVNKLNTRGFVKWANDGKTAAPCGVTRIQNLDHADIIAYYNMIIRGILNYYSFADNHKSLGAIIRILQMSCARTLALKYKLRAAAKAFKKFGKYLAEPKSKKGLAIPNTYARTRTFKINEPLAMAAIERSWSNKLTRSNLAKTCVVCGVGPAEMHHVRQIKDLVS